MAMTKQSSSWLEYFLSSKIFICYLRLRLSLLINLRLAAWFGPVIFQKARVKFECIPFFSFSLTAPGKELQPECYQTLYETLGANYSCCKSWYVPPPFSILIQHSSSLINA